MIEREEQKCYCKPCGLEFKSPGEWAEHAKECKTIKAFRDGFMKDMKKVNK